MKFAELMQRFEDLVIEEHINPDSAVVSLLRTEVEEAVESALMQIDRWDPNADFEMGGARSIRDAMFIAVLNYAKNTDADVLGVEYRKVVCFAAIRVIREIEFEEKTERYPLEVIAAVLIADIYTCVNRMAKVVSIFIEKGVLGKDELGQDFLRFKNLMDSRGVEASPLSIAEDALLEKCQTEIPVSCKNKIISNLGRPDENGVLRRGEAEALFSFDESNEQVDRETQSCFFYAEFLEKEVNSLIRRLDSVVKKMIERENAKRKHLSVVK